MSPLPKDYETSKLQNLRLGLKPLNLNIPPTNFSLASFANSKQYTYVIFEKKIILFQTLNSSILFYYKFCYEQ